MTSWLTHTVVAALCLLLTLTTAGALLPFVNQEGNELTLFAIIVVVSASVVGYFTAMMATKYVIPVDSRDVVQAVATYRKWMAACDTHVIDAESRAMRDVLREFAESKQGRR